MADNLRHPSVMARGLAAVHDRFDDAGELQRDLLQLHRAKFLVGLTPSQFRRYVAVLERVADLRGASIADLGQELFAETAIAVNAQLDGVPGRGTGR